VTADQSAVRRGAPEGVVDAVVLRRHSNGAQGDGDTAGELVKVVAGDVGQPDPDGQSALGVDQPLAELGHEPVDGAGVEAVQFGDRCVGVDAAVGAPPSDHVADPIGGVGVDVQH